MDISGFWVGYGVRSFIVAIIFWYLLWKKYDWEALKDVIIERE
jgi:hypothetical protein